MKKRVNYIKYSGHSFNQGYFLGLKMTIWIALSLFICLFPKTGYGSADSPFGNVKLPGRAYYYPIGLDGSPYLFDDWESSNIYLANGEIAKNVKIKFNLISNDIIFYNEELKKVFIVDKNIVKQMVINPGNQDSLIFIKYLGENSGFRLKNDDYVQQLQKGTVFFFVKNFADVVNASDVNSKNKVYSRKLYFIQSSGITLQIKPNYRSIYKLFPGKRKDIKKLIASNKIMRPNESNLIKLIGLINQDSTIYSSFKTGKK